MSWMTHWFRRHRKPKDRLRIFIYYTDRENLMTTLADVLATVAAADANADLVIAKAAATPPSTEPADLDQINTAVAAINTKLVAALTPSTT